MPKDLFSRYVWLVDTIRRHGTITRQALNEKWLRTPFSEGRDLSRRTFYNYRQAIEELFQIHILCNPVTYEYSIDEGPEGSGSITDWLLNSAATNDILSSARDVADRIFIEEVPSARTHLGAVIEALKEHHPLRLSYHPYTRSKATSGIVLEPYFLKIFRQRWYITGYNVRDRRLKTYALDRITELSIDSTKTFEMPADFDAAQYQSQSFGIVFDEGEPHKVMLRANARRAKYLRALPLHHSQQESVHDDYSIFTYYIKLTPDLIQELLSLGPDVTVLSPPELRAMMTETLRRTLDTYT